MKILYDGGVYEMQATGGINRYFANLIKNLPSDCTPILTTCRSLTLTSPVHPNLKTYFYPRLGFRPGRISYWLEKYYFRLANIFSSPHIIHPTYYRLLTREEIKQGDRPLVLTVWDMIHELFPEELDTHGYQAEAKRNAVFSAQAVICISENTKKDLLERYPSLESKITVTPLASEIDITLSYGSEKVPEKPYYLYIGSRLSYKNFDTLLLAFKKVLSVHSDLMLCVVGSAFKDEEKKLIAELGLTEHVDQYNWTSDRHLAKLYRCSIGLVYPSLYEGFGIPPLEAMACGTVAITSNSSSLPEVVGDAGLLFDPKSINDLADILIALIENPAERDTWIAKGFERAKAFNWSLTAAETVKIYRSLID